MASRRSDADPVKLPRPSSPYIIKSSLTTETNGSNKRSSRSRLQNRRRAKGSGIESGRRHGDVTLPREDNNRKRDKADNNNGVSRDKTQQRSKNREGDPYNPTDSASQGSSSYSGHSSSRSSYTDETRSRDSWDEERQRRWERKEVRSLRKSVENKLTYLVNDGQRENSFSPLGVLVTTYKMLPYDVQYKVLEAEMDKTERSRNKKNEKKNRSRLISPTLDKHSTPLILHKRMARITEFANQVFESVPVNDLALIHRYRPHSPDIGKAPEYGDVQNYNCHVGAALHTKQYVDFYLREGLHTGNRENSPRLQHLHSKKKIEEKKATKKAENGSNSKVMTSERQKPKFSQQTQDQNNRNKNLYRETSFTNSVEGEEPETDNDRNTATSRATSADRYSSETSTPNPHVTSANELSQSDDADRIDGYSNDFDAEETSSSKDRDVDTVSIHTYVSMEHASRTDGETTTSQNDVK